MYTEEIAPEVVNRFYRTGDIVREDSNQNLTFLGRNDRQIKLRGYRVELDEVEAVLGKHGDVKEVAVFLWQDGNGDKSIAAAVISQNDREQSAEHLLTFCKDNLPAYAVPQQVFFMGRISQDQLRQNKAFRTNQVINPLMT